MSSDRLAEIKARYADGILPYADIDWLLAEVERLRDDEDHLIETAVIHERRKVEAEIADWLEETDFNDPHDELTLASNTRTEVAIAIRSGAYRKEQQT